MNSFFRELKQRKVYRVALSYAVIAWLVVHCDDYMNERLLPFMLTYSRSLDGAIL